MIQTLPPMFVNAGLLLVVALVASCDKTGSEMIKASLSEYISGYPDQTIAVSVVDPAAELNFDIRGNRVFHAASTMKIPVMMELFRRADAGELSLDDSLLVKNEFASIIDGSLFSIEDDTDDVIYTLLGNRMSFRDLNYNMITVSSNLATNLLVEFLGAESIQRFLGSIGATRMKVFRGVEDLKAYRAGKSNTATANDLATLLSRLLQSADGGDKAATEMIEVLLQQKFNSLIPAGLPASYRVAHKTGWITGIRHDAAIVYPPDSRPFVLVVLTDGFDDQDRAAKAIGDIAGIVNLSIR